MLHSFTGEMLANAVVKADHYIIDSLPSAEDIDHQFSLGFERKMRKLIKKSIKIEPFSRPKLRKRFAIILAAIIILLASAMSVSAVRTKVFELITEVYERFTHISFKEEQPTQTHYSDTNDKEFMQYTPTFMPSGFELVNEDHDKIVLLEYEDGDDFISYKQQRLEDVSVKINTEGAMLEDVKFDGSSAYYYSNKGVQNLIWYDDTYMFMVSSTLNKDTIFKIAESVKPAILSD